MISYHNLWKNEVAGFNIFRPNYSIPPDWPDLVFLYQEVLRLQPQSILELGSGCSTVTLWYALKELGKGQLISLEADPYWYGVNAAALYRLRIMDKADSPLLVFSPIVYDHEGYLRYQFNPGRHRRVDFIYIDGPKLWKRDDVVIEPQLFVPEAREIVIDGRRSQGEFMRDTLAAWYEVEWNEKEKRYVFQRREQCDGKGNV